MPDTLIPIRQYADTAANLAAVNPVPLARQLVIESDKGRAKLGDGVTAYNSLPYVFGAPGTGISGTAATYAGLPAPGSASGEFWAVIGSQGTSWLPGPLGGTYYSAGVYYSNGASWTYVGSAPYQASQADVDAGVINNQFVTPATFASASKWSTKQDNITLTTSGTSGAATLAAGTLNIPQYQAALTNPVTGTGASGQVTFWTGTNTQSGSTNFVWDESKKAIRIGNTSGSPTSLNSSNIVTGNWFSIYASLTDSGGFFREILSFKSAAYIFNSGADYTPIIFRQQSGDSLTIAGTTKNVGISNSSPGARLTVRGSGITSASSSLLIENSAASAKLTVKDDGSIEIGKNDSGTTQSTASITVISGDTNTGLALVTKGLGALTVDLPDGTTTGGAARGSNAVDLQGRRSNANQVAGGAYSVIVGGWDNRASATECAVVCGYQNAATTQASFIGSGYFNTASGSNSAIVCGYQNSVSGSNSTIAGGNQNTLSGSTAFIGGGNGNSNSGGSGALCGGVQNVVSSFSWQFLGGGYQNSTNGNASTVTGGAFNTITSGSYSTIGGGYGNTIAVDEAVIVGGRNARAYLLGQSSNASGQFATQGDAQTSNIRYRNSITGTAKTELFLDGASVRAILALPTGATNARLWNAKVQIAAICTTQGNGTVTAGESFIGNYAVGISRIGNTTSLIGTVQNLHTPQTSTNMATAVVDITADDTNEALKIEFTPPTTAGSTTIIRVVATVYLTEVGY